MNGQEGQAQLNLPRMRGLTVKEKLSVEASLAEGQERRERLAVEALKRKGLA